MVKKISFFTIALGVALVALNVLAAGGGGGGSVPSCTEDVWDCTGWSQCSAEGNQTRTCSLIYDCYSATTPEPAETQACVVPTPPTPEAEPIPTPQPLPISLPPEKTPTSSVACSQDTWTCSAWENACDANGRDHRACRISSDCPNIETPPPSSSRACQVLQCGDKSTLRERISCRLNLAPAGVARELEIQYLPEGCKAETGEERQECIARYRSFQPCWNVPAGDKRFVCAKNALQLGTSIATELQKCQGTTGAANTECRHEAKDKALYMIVFRFYDLETRAEALTDRGASLEAIADFETVIETKKQEFYQATTYAQRRQIILDVREAWRDFLNTVKDQII